MDLVASGYILPEAPRDDGAGGVVFSDVIGGGIHRARSDGSVELLHPARKGIGGLLPRQAGGWMASGRDLVAVRDGAEETILDLVGATGLNDMTSDSEGRVIVGSLRFRPFRGESPIPGEIYRLSSDGTVEELARGIDWPNGIGISPDGETLYVSDYAVAVIRAYRLGDAAPATPLGVFAAAPSGNTDGLAVDQAGGVWVALGSAGSLLRFTADGVVDRTIETPLGFVTSLCFAGADLRRMFVTGVSEDPELGGQVYTFETDRPGLPVAAASI